MNKTRLLLTMSTAMVGCVGLLGLGVASGSTSKVTHSKVKITKIAPDGVAGVVTSSEAACEKGRTARLYYSPSPARQGEETLLGKDKTNKKGKWALDGSFFVGHYHVVVPSKTVKLKRQKGKLEEATVEAEEDADDDSKGGDDETECTTTTYTTSE